MFNKIKVVGAIVSEVYPFSLNYVSVKVGSEYVEFSGEEWEAITSKLTEAGACSFINYYIDKKVGEDGDCGVQHHLRRFME